MPTTTSTAGPSHVSNRMISLKNTTMGWFKGGNKNQTGSRKREIATSGSIIVAEEQTSPSTALVLRTTALEPIEVEKDAETPRSRLYTPCSAIDITHSRVASPTGETEGSLQRLALTPHKQYHDAEEYILAPPHEEAIENGFSDSKATQVPGTQNAGKKKSTKLKIAAFNVLRMKNNSFLKRSQDREEEGSTQTRTSVDPYSNNGGKYSLTRSNSTTSPSMALTLASASGTHSRRGAKLTKPPPRRSTVVEAINEDSVDPLENVRPNGWPIVDNRPSSSQSSAPGATLHRGDDVTSIGADPNIVTGGNAPGGLYPRPSSLKRHWSDGPRDKDKRESFNQMGGGPSTGPPPEGTDRPRPLSFSGILNTYNTYGTMKITEAASLESRVRELEGQVATLQTFINQHMQSQNDQSERRVSDKSSQVSPKLGPPFREDSSFSKRPDTSHTMNTTSTFLHGHTSESSIHAESSINGGTSKASGSVDWRSLARGGPLTPTKTPYGDNSASSILSDETINLRRRAYEMLDGGPGPSTGPPTTASKRSTIMSMSTITPSRNQNRDSEADYHRERTPQQNTVSMAEYTGVVSMLRREHRARKELESKIAILQEQMAHVLHRQLLQRDHIFNRGRSPTITARSLATASAASRPDMQSLRRRASSEVPTPDLTPPRGRHELNRRGSHLFPGFDSSVSAGDEMEDDRSFYFNGDEDDNENWQTPTEDTRSLLQLENGNGTIRGHLIPPLTIGSQKRTMSISQITEKASAAAAHR